MCGFVGKQQMERFDEMQGFVNISLAGFAGFWAFILGDSWLAAVIVPAVLFVLGKMVDFLVRLYFEKKYRNK
jgi:hypothetical protein